MKVNRRMKLNLAGPTPYLHFIHAMSLLIPRHARTDWRREWEAEIINRWRMLQKRNRLNLKSKLDLAAKVAGATHDVASFQNNKGRLVLVTLNIIVAFVLGFPAVREFASSGIRDGRLFFLIVAAILVSILFIISSVAMLREWTAVRSLVFITGVLSLLVHVYGALPPHRNMGYLALLIGAGYAVVMICVYQRNAPPRNPIT